MIKYAIFKILKSKRQNEGCKTTLVTEFYFCGIRIYYNEYKE